MRSTCILIITGVLAVGAGSPTPPRAAGPSAPLDRQVLIEGLKNEGMLDLLYHMAESPRESLSEMERTQIKASVQLLRSRSPRLAREYQIAALNQAIEFQRELIKKNKDNYLRPVWQTALAEWLMLNKVGLESPGALEAAEFGVLSPEQRKVFEPAVVEAYLNLVEANYRLDMLPAELPKDPEWRSKIEPSGLPKLLFDDYKDRLTAFRLAQAAYYATMLSPDNPYFTQKVLYISDKGSTYEREVKRLGAEAATGFRNLLKVKQLSNALQVKSFQGRAQIAAGETAEGIRTLESVKAANKGDGVDLISQAAIIRQRAASDPTFDVSAAMDALLRHPAARQERFYILLLTDLEHQVLMGRAKSAPAEKQADLITASFKPYERLLNNPTLSADDRRDFQQYVDQRWATTVKADSAEARASLPTVVLQSLARSQLETGRGLIFQAHDLLDKGEKEKAAALVAEAGGHLTRSIELNQSLASRKGVAPAVLSACSFNQGMAIFLRDALNDDPEAQRRAKREACQKWIETAAAYPGFKEGEEAIANATRVLGELSQTKPSPEWAREMYEQAVKLLFEKYPVSTAAQNQHAEYAFSVLVPAGRFQEAIDHYQKVAPGHPNYWNARRDILYCYKKLVDRAADAKTRAEAEDRLIEAAKALIADADNQMQGAAQPEEKAAHHAAWGYARLCLADAYISRRQADAALEALKNWEQDFGQDASEAMLLRDGMGKRIVAFFSANQPEQGLKSADEMITKFPDEALPIISQVLDSLQDRLAFLQRQEAEATDPQKKQELADLRKKIGASVEPLADSVYKMGQERKFDSTRMFSVNLARALGKRIAGKPEESLKIIEPLYKDERYKNDVDVVNAMAESLFLIDEHKGKTDHLDQAKRLYVSIMSDLPAGEGDKYPPVWWNAWMRYLQIMDKNNQGKDLAKSVRQLRTMLRIKEDAPLGEEPYASEIQRLYEKHSGPAGSK